MQPTGNRVLIKADPSQEKTASGLYITEDWKSLPPTGTVIAVGPDVQNIQPKDRVVFERYGSIIVDKENRMCLESQVLATLPKAKTKQDETHD